VAHQISLVGGVFTIRLDGRSNAQQVYQDIRKELDTQNERVNVILDLTHSSVLAQDFKAMFYRVFQNAMIVCVGICGIKPETQQDMNELASALHRMGKRILINETEIDLRVDMGLDEAVPGSRKLSGMLTYLKKA
jgi:hypothetical protein